MSCASSNKVISRPDPSRLRVVHIATALHAFVHDNLAACLYPLWHAVGMMSMTYIFRPVMIAAATAAALTVVAPSTDAAAQTQATGARELLLLCQARAEQPELDLAQCSAYLRGFLDRVLQDQVNGREPEFCPPRARVSAQTAASALTRLASVNRQHWMNRHRSSCRWRCNGPSPARCRISVSRWPMASSPPIRFP